MCFAEGQCTDSVSQNWLNQCVVQLVFVCDCEACVVPNCGKFSEGFVGLLYPVFDCRAWIQVICKYDS